MNYIEELKKIDNINGAFIASLVGLDGISLSSHTKADNGDVPVIDAELATLMTVAKQSMDTINAGDIYEIVVFTGNYSFVLTFIGKEYYLYIGLQGRDADMGKARTLLYEMRKVFYKDIYE